LDEDGRLVDNDLVEGRHIWRPSREYVRFLGFPVIAQVGANAIHGVHGPNLTLSNYVNDFVV